MTDYHDTTAARPDELAIRKRGCEHQQTLVLAIFQEFRTPMSPFQVWAVYTERGHKQTPLTSIRRAISNLTKDSYLIRTRAQRIGPYGRQEYQWQLATAVAG